MQKAKWLGLTLTLVALVIAGAAALLQHGTRARLPVPPGEGKTEAPTQTGTVDPDELAALVARAEKAAPSPRATLEAEPTGSREDAPVAALERKEPAGRAAAELYEEVLRQRAASPRVPPSPDSAQEGPLGGLASPARPGEGPRAPFSAPAPVAMAPAKSAAVATPPGVAAPRFKKDLESWRVPNPPVDREGYDHIAENPFLAVAANPLSTFSIDVDTASYSNVRRFLTSGQLPPKDAVRIEELVNYFRYDYPEPRGREPFSITSEVAGCPWTPDHRLVLVGLRGRSLEEENLPPRNLTFLLDVSGSMNSPDKLPLLKKAMGLLVNTLREEDRVAIVVYAGASGLVLPPTSGDQKGTIMEALDSLRAGGSTAGARGIVQAYQVAAESYVEGGINRVILATDGDFNVGLSSEGELVRLIEDQRKSGIFLSVLGFGRGNLQDSKMEKLADHGNGNYSYIDSVREARKVLVTEAGATLVTIAKDVKIQVEFNPARVKAYRLIGYENRALRAEDFADDRKDAGEIGAGHTVTALYEVVPVGVDIDLPAVDPLKYQSPPKTSSESRELLTVKLRHKAPDGDTSRLRSVPVVATAAGVEPSANLRFASAVAAFGMLLRESEHRGSATWDQVVSLARGAVGDDPDGHRTEFLVLARNAEQLSEIERVAISR